MEAGSDARVLALSVEDPGAFSAVWERQAGAVARYLARRVGRDLADDLTAEVFVRAFRARRSYQDRNGSALPWLLGIANHLVRDDRRAERRRMSALARLVASEPEVVGHEAAGLAPELVSELRRLPQADRDTLLLVVWGELSYEEAADALGVPVGTVRSRIARARGRLVAALEPLRHQAGDRHSELGLGGEGRG
jgi:RNA polymerase sigma factor (sigma-70 family)